uniref:Uncharacterized protein n=1 Tax=Anguilla anguilla TaxID=7936 RepID=A0A0E9XZX2_ANGAN
MPDNQNEWNSVCWTWDGKTGLTQVWVNGKAQHKGEDHHRHSPSWNSHHNPWPRSGHLWWGL